MIKKYEVFKAELTEDGEVDGFEPMDETINVNPNRLTDKEQGAMFIELLQGYGFINANVDAYDFDIDTDNDVVVISLDGIPQLELRSLENDDESELSKSAILRNMAEELGIEVVEYPVVYADPEDLKGIAVIND